MFVVDTALIAGDDGRLSNFPAPKRRRPERSRSGSIYAAWGTLGYEHSALGLPTSAEIQEPEWVVQNFQHGTLNMDRGAGQSFG